MEDEVSALAETLRKAAQKWASELVDKPPYWEALAEAAMPTLRAALAPGKPEPTFPEIQPHEYTFGKGKSAPAADGAGEVEAIRERHEAIEKGNFAGFFYDAARQEQAHDDRATLLHLLDAERARRVEVEKAARQLLNGASGHYMNAEDRWCLESLLGFYDEDMPATHKDTQDE